MCPPAALRTASKRASALLQVARMYSGSFFFHARFSCFFRFSKFLRQIAAAFIYNHINGWSNSCQRILWVFVSRLLCENGWRYIEYKSMFLYNFLWPKKKEKTDFFLTPAVWPQIAAQSVSLLIDTLYSCRSSDHLRKFDCNWSKVDFEAHATIAQILKSQRIAA